MTIASLMLAAASVAPGAEPLWEMVPPVEYAAPCPLPEQSWGTARSDDGTDRGNVITVGAGLLRWNSSPIAEKALLDLVRIVSDMKPRPRISLYAPDASCPELRRIAALVAKEARCTPADCLVLSGPPPVLNVPMVTAPPEPPRPAPPPPPAEPGGQKARPSNNPQSWVSNDDYPAAALRAEQSGTVWFRLYIDDTGAITDCVVSGSSGSPILDNATCSLLRRRARFLPATDARGRPVAASWTSRVRWELPERVLVTPTSYAHAIQFTLDANGKILDCREDDYGSPDLGQGDTCAELNQLPAANLRKLRGTTRGPVTIIIRFDHVVDGIKMPRTPLIPAGFRTIMTRRANFEIDETGKTVNCKGDAVYSELPMSMLGCDSWDRYTPGERRYSAMISFTVVTNGDPNVVAALERLTD